MSGNVGCNGFGGEYELNGDQITFNGIMSTLMFCEETSAQEQGVLGLFSDNAALQIQVNGASLTIDLSGWRFCRHPCAQMICPLYEG